MTAPVCADRGLAVGRLLHKADFERLLATPVSWRSAHFAVQHVQACATRPGARLPRPDKADLSTAMAPGAALPVDKVPDRHWLGVVVPKRHAKRAVTRSLLKRQMRAAVARHVQALPPGLWLLRLRQPFALRGFPSAASVALASAAREELDRLLQKAARGPAGHGREARGSGDRGRAQRAAQPDVPAVPIAAPAGGGARA